MSFHSLIPCHVRFSSEYFAAGQTEQVLELVAPIGEENFPLGHSRHSMAVEYEPAGHDVHTDMFDNAE